MIFGFAWKDFLIIFLVLLLPDLLPFSSFNFNHRKQENIFSSQSKSLLENSNFDLTPKLSFFSFSSIF